MEKKKIPSRRRILIALVLGGIFGGFVVSFNEPWGNTPKEIQQVEDAIGKEYADIGKVIHNYSEKTGETIHLRCLGPTWEKIEEITSPLVYENERIAKAKALLHFEEDPTSPSRFSSFGGNDLWTERFDVSKQDWKIQSFSSRILTSAGRGIGVFFAITIIAYLVLTIVPWLWYFLLSRISELSQAVRGK